MQLIDRGTTPGPRGAMTGFRGTVVRIVSTSGFITGVDLWGAYGIEAPMVQRWLAPANDGAYSRKSPGFFTDDNTVSSVWNYDSHLLDPHEESAGALTEGGDVTMPSAMVPTPSDSAQGYGIGGAIGAPGGTLGGSYFPAGLATTLDIAYIVSHDPVRVDAAIRTFNDGWLEAHETVLPEAGTAGTIVVLMMLAGQVSEWRARRLV